MPLLCDNLTFTLTQMHILVILNMFTFIVIL